MLIRSLLMTALLNACVLMADAQTVTADRRPGITLHTGDNAPPIVAAKWFKGKPVTSYVPGHVYVVEFWATWCGPCRAAMPHLSELANHYKDTVTFIGMDILELIAGKDKNGDYITKVGNFVKNLGDGMDYTVAADTREGIMNDTWMKAAGLGGIPSSFVIDQQGKIAWIGHPMMLEDVLKLVVSGHFDSTAREQMKTAWQKKNAQIKAMTEQLAELKKSGQYSKAIALTDQMIASSVLGKPGFIINKYELLLETDKAKAAAYAKEVMSAYANDPITLQAFAQRLITSDSREDKNLAVKIMEKAVARSAPDDPYAYSNLAEVYFKSGAFKSAVSTQEKVVAILADTSLVTQKDEVIQKAKDTLESYKAELSAGKTTINTNTN